MVFIHFSNKTSNIRKKVNIYEIRKCVFQYKLFSKSALLKFFIKILVNFSWYFDRFYILNFLLFIPFVNNCL